MVLFSVLGKFGGVTGGTDGLRFAAPDLRSGDAGARRFESALLAARARCWRSGGRLLRAPLLSLRAGQALAAIKTNETRLEYLGISAHASLGGYVLAAALCGPGRHPVRR